jgi:anaerobic dimethyl sulfoxide reductase subunit A
LKYPLKRVGPKGKGQFERISWDQAFDAITDKLKKTKETSGNSSIFLGTHFGYQGQLHSGSYAMARLLAMFGGYTTYYGNASSEACIWASLTQYGSIMVGHSRDDFLNSKLIILWGWDPARMISGTNTTYWLIRAKEAGSKDYVTGLEDGIEKTPAWAEAITGVKAQTIEELAQEYATTKPASLMDCMGAARSAMGEQYTRCAMTMCALTGNVGRSGGSAGGGLMTLPIGHLFMGPTIPGVKNPVEAGGPSLRGSVDLQLRLARRIHVNKIFDAILKGKDGGYPADIKLAWLLGNNFLNQLCNTNKAAQALRKLNFLIVSELFMTPTAKFADILLPVTSAAEINDLTRPWPSGPYYTFVNQAIKPLGECKSDFQIACELSDKLGINDFNSLSEEEWLKQFIEKNPEYAKNIMNYEKFRREGVHRVKLDEPIVAFQEEIKDPENNLFRTPSGKIEIYSQRVAELNNSLCPPIPKYVSTKEDLNDPLIEKYPLQLLTPHAKNRIHSTMYKVDWLREIEPHRAWINPVDSEPRNIKDGDEIYVFNDRGKLAIEARVTERIMPGVICIFEGAWYDPDDEGIDRGGCANVLTNDAHSECGASTMNTTLVQVSNV